jgi:hypothetical protein
MGIVIRPRQRGDLPPLLLQKVSAVFDGRKRSTGLPELCLDLLSEQKKMWLDFREGDELLKTVRSRNLCCGGFSVRLQFNPGRIKNSLGGQAEGDAKERRCFLCPDHLPEDQKGILYRGEYLILCNPRPVFTSHFTVSHREHRAQAITGPIDTLLRLTADFGSDWTVLYNGPKCGASAPDHLHFQAIPTAQMPIENEIREQKRLTLLREADGILLARVRDLGREVILLEGADSIAVSKVFKAYLKALRKALLINEEPMVNLAAHHQEGIWHLMIFPRRKHRPDAFFRKGDARVMVSPGVIDMGGVLITPVEKDFDRLDAAAVEGIYREVSLEGETVKQAIDALTGDGSPFPGKSRSYGTLATIIPERD